MYQYSDPVMMMHGEGLNIKIGLGYIIQSYLKNSQIKPNKLSLNGSTLCRSVVKGLPNMPEVVGPIPLLHKQATIKNKFY